MKQLVGIIQVEMRNPFDLRHSSYERGAVYEQLVCDMRSVLAIAQKA